MTRVIEADEQGAIHLSAEWLKAKPHARFIVDREGERVTLRPAEQKQATDDRPLWERLTPQERIEDFLRWANKPRPDAPSLSDEALRRENLYED